MDQRVRAIRLLQEVQDTFLSDADNDFLFEAALQRLQILFPSKSAVVYIHLYGFNFKS